MRLSVLELIPLVPTLLWVALLWRIGRHRVGAGQGGRSRLGVFVQLPDKLLSRGSYDSEGQRLVPLLWAGSFVWAAAVLLYLMLRSQVGWDRGTGSIPKGVVEAINIGVTAAVGAAWAFSVFRAQDYVRHRGYRASAFWLLGTVVILTGAALVVVAWLWNA